MPLETRYAKSGDVNIAYQVVGKSGPDLVLVMGWVSHLDYFWQEPRFARFLTQLASFSRLILFDKRGTGLSDRVAGPATLEERMDDVRAVMDSVGSERASLLGISEGAAMCILFAATYPGRTTALITFGGFPRRIWAPDFPWGPTMEERQSHLQQVESDWGGPVGLALRAPSLKDDRQFQEWWATYLRMSASPGAAVALSRMNMEIDIRHVLPSIRVPTLVMHRTGDLLIPVEVARFMAGQIRHARYVEFPGQDHLPFVGNQEPVLREIERLLGPAGRQGETDSLLATVLAVELADATITTSRMGEREWREISTSFASIARRELASFRGREIRLNEASFLAAFDGPARAARCARSVLAEARRLGVTARAGLHTGECEVLGREYTGIPLLVAAKVMGQAEPNEVLASTTVRDLVAGSGLQFAEAHDRSVGEWHLCRLTDDDYLNPRSISARDVRPPGSSLDRLTPREREVATLLATGMSNQQIADELVLSIGTVERHVSNIFTKLGFHSRSQVAAWVAQSGLIGK